jgi:putative hemolysin
MWTELLIILTLVLLNGLFAGAEIAVIALRSTRVDELANEHAAGRHLAALRRDPERFLATVQIGITTVGATAAAFGGATFAEHLAQRLEYVGVAPETAENVALATVVTAVSYLSLVLGELVPKSLGLKWAERYALLCARPLDWLARACGPLVWLLTASSNLVLRAFGDQTSFAESQISRDELLAALEKATNHGEVSTHAGRIAAQALELDDLHVGAVMVPRGAVVGVPLTASRDDIARILATTDEDRFPVLRGHEDVVGYVTTRDLARLLTGSLPDLASAMRPIHTAPERASALDLLVELQRRRVPIAVVVDESGSFEGIVDVDDLAEEIVGSLATDAHRALAPTEGGTIVPAALRVHLANRWLRLSLPTSKQWSTIGGLFLAQMGAIPTAGERITLQDGTELEVVETSARRLLRVRIKPPPPPA